MTTIEPEPGLILAGCQSGDEGKGRFTDIYAADAWAVVRYQGGPHTGHTVSVNDTRYRFVQVPSGALHGTLGILGNGCVIDPVSLIAEIDALAAQGIDPRLAIAETAHVIFPHHRAQDAAMERFRGRDEAVSAATGFRTGEGRLGSTCKGVGPCREDKIARIGLRLVDLTDIDLLAARLRRLLPMKRAVVEQLLGAPVAALEGYRPTDWDVESLVAQYSAAGRRLADYLCDVPVLLAEARRDGRRLLYEGAQSAGLDVEHGSYPFCSSGYSAANGVHVGTGTPPGVPFKVFGVMKSYMTQVGGGPLPTEIAGPTADHIIDRGFEYGVVTGRRRRVGWLDLPFVRRARSVDGFSDICLSCLDVLAGLDEVRVATHYRIDGELVDLFPRSLSALARAEPVYEILVGWAEIDWSVAARRGLDGLPPPARDYARYVAGSLGVGIAAIGIGPSREQTIVLRSPFGANGAARPA